MLQAIVSTPDRVLLLEQEEAELVLTMQSMQAR